jgi:hypothetical protein
MRAESASNATTVGACGIWVAASLPGPPEPGRDAQSLADIRDGSDDG